MAILNREEISLEAQLQALDVDHIANMGRAPEAWLKFIVDVNPHDAKFARAELARREALEA